MALRQAEADGEHDEGRRPPPGDAGGADARELQLRRPRRAGPLAQKCAVARTGRSIAIENLWRDGQTNIEAKLIRDVAGGRIRYGTGSEAVRGTASGSRASTRSIAVSDRQLPARGSLCSKARYRCGCWHRSAGLGLVGIGILPGELRRVVGVEKPLLRVGDFRGLRFGTTASRAARDTMQLLGASPVPFLKLTSVRGFGGFDFPITSFEANRYDVQARFITTNLAFWPRPLVIFMNERAYERLAPSQRALVRLSARRSISGAVETTHRAEQKSIAALCLRGRTRFVRGVGSGPRADSCGDRPRAHLGRRRDTPLRARRRADQTSARRAAAARADLPAARLERRRDPERACESTMTAADGRRAHIPAGAPVLPRPADRHRLVIRGRTFDLFDGYPDGHTEVSMEGTYTSYRGKVVFSTTTETLLPISGRPAGADCGSSTFRSTEAVTTARCSPRPGRRRASGAGTLPRRTSPPRRALHAQPAAGRLEAVAEAAETGTARGIGAACA